MKYLFSLLFTLYTFDPVGFRHDWAGLCKLDGSRSSKNSFFRFSLLRLLLVGTLEGVLSCPDEGFDIVVVGIADGCVDLRACGVVASAVEQEGWAAVCAAPFRSAEGLQREVGHAQVRLGFDGVYVVGQLDEG